MNRLSPLVTALQASAGQVVSLQAWMQAAAELNAQLRRALEGALGQLSRQGAELDLARAKAVQAEARADTLQLADTQRREEDAVEVLQRMMEGPPVQVGGAFTLTSWAYCPSLRCRPCQAQKVECNLECPL